MHAGGGQAAVHLEQEGGNALERRLASEQQHMVLGMLQVAGRHVQEVDRDQGVAFRNMLQAASFHQSHGRVDDRLGGKPMKRTVFQAKDVADQVKSADLTAAIGKQLVASDRAVDDLVDVVGRLRFAKNFGALVVFEFAEDDPRAGKLAKLSDRRRPAAGMGVDVDKHGYLPFFEANCSTFARGTGRPVLPAAEPH